MDNENKEEAKVDAGQNTAHVAGKAAAGYFGGAAGRFAYDKVSQTKLGQGIERGVGKTIAKTPTVGNVNKKLNDTGVVNKADKAISLGQKSKNDKTPSNLKKNQSNRKNNTSFLKRVKGGGFFNDIQDNEMSSETLEEDSVDILTKAKKIKKTLIIIAPIIFFLFIILFIISLVGYMGSLFGAFGGKSTTLTDPETLQNENEKKYYQKLDEVINKYEEKCGISIKKEYVHTILIYPITNFDNFFSENAMNEEINHVENNIDYSNLTGKIETVVKILTENCTIDYTIGGKSYNSLKNSSFFKDYYKELLKTIDIDTLLTRIFETAESGASLFNNSWFITDNLKVVMGTCQYPYTSEYLNGTKENSTIGFSDYIKGVIYGEKGGSINENSKEFLKAFTIVTTSYVLARSGYSPGDTEIWVHNGNCWQLSCDIRKGCTYAYDQPNGTGGQNYGTTYTGKVEKDNFMFYHGPLASDKEQIINEVFSEVFGTVMVTSEGKIQWASHRENCSNGCFGQTNAYNDALSGMNYLDILDKYYVNDYTLVNMQEDLYADAVTYDNGGYNSEVVYYNQQNYNNPFCGRTDGGTIAKSGCGVTSMAIVLSTLVNRSYNPVVVMNEAYSMKMCGTGIVGTSPSFFKSSAQKHNLQYLLVSKTGNLQLVLNALKSGNSLVIAHMGKGTFTNSGHYIVLSQVNSKGEVYVYDPYKKSRNGWYDFNSVIVKQLLGSFHIITKG